MYTCICEKEFSYKSAIKQHTLTAWEEKIKVRKKTKFENRRKYTSSRKILPMKITRNLEKIRDVQKYVAPL